MSIDHPSEADERLGRSAFEVFMVETNGEKGWIDLGARMRRRWVKIALTVIEAHKAQNGHGA
jgi:hypothetical protein